MLVGVSHHYNSFAQVKIQKHGGGGGAANRPLKNLFLQDRARCPRSAGSATDHVLIGLCKNVWTKMLAQKWDQQSPIYTPPPNAHQMSPPPYPYHL